MTDQNIFFKCLLISAILSNMFLCSCSCSNSPGSDGAGNVKPATPANLSANNPTDTTIDLSWTSSTDSDGSVEKYKIYISSPPESDYSIEIDANQTTFTVNNLEKGPIYYFKISAIDDRGGESELSNETVERIKIYEDYSEYFDFDNNELLNFLREGLIHSHNKSLSLNSDIGITDVKIKDLLWDGLLYEPTGTGENTDFKGLLFNENPASAAPDTEDGYITQLAKTVSQDSVDKAFRQEVDTILNATSSYKTVMPDYSTGNENIFESILTNIQLQFLSRNYSPENKKWAVSRDDGRNYFGDPERNIRNTTGKLHRSLRNLLVLDKNGETVREHSMLSELLYFLSASHGIVDPVNAPAILTLKQSLLSMNSILGSQKYLDLPLDMTLDVIDNNTSYRSQNNETDNTPLNWQEYSSQWDTDLLEMLQPGVFKNRNGSTTGDSWFGKFSASQGDIIGSKNTDTGLNTSNWILSEIALASWEGYGPYTFQGKAPMAASANIKMTGTATGTEYPQQREPGDLVFPNKGPLMAMGQNSVRFVHHMADTTYMKKYGKKIIIVNLDIGEIMQQTVIIILLHRMKLTGSC